MFAIRLVLLIALGGITPLTLPPRRSVEIDLIVNLTFQFLF